MGKFFNKTAGLFSKKENKPKSLIEANDPTRNILYETVVNPRLSGEPSAESYNKLLTSKAKRKAMRG